MQAQNHSRQQHYQTTTTTSSNDDKVEHHVIKKPIPHSHAGIHFGKDGQGRLTVAGLHEDGLFYNKTNIQVGMKVLQVNGINVERMSPQNVSAVIRSARGYVTIVTEGSNSSSSSSPEEYKRIPKQQQQPCQGRTPPRSAEKDAATRRHIITAPEALKRILMMPKAA